MNRFSETQLNGHFASLARSIEKVNTWDFGTDDSPICDVWRMMNEDLKNPALFKSIKKQIEHAFGLVVLNVSEKALVAGATYQLPTHVKTARDTIMRRMTRGFESIRRLMAIRFDPPTIENEIPSDLIISDPPCKRPRMDFGERVQTHFDGFIKKNREMGPEGLAIYVKLLTEHLAWIGEEQKCMEHNLSDWRALVVPAAPSCNAATPAPARRRRATVARSAGSSSGGGCTTGSSSGGGCTTGDNGDDDDFDDDGTEVGDGGGSVADAIQLDI
ncbi:hypothetical protein B484DRAFT_409748 [Ochromonadaceae sp. CCMP2298]|nr:hypothetical protein B484DRAFT_409748 [Ochromonadaceae sp. CCMP2298]